MKRYSFIFFLASFLGVTSFTACEEEATLDGATEVYITIDPMDINLKLGDTVRISATVTNVSGSRTTIRPSVLFPWKTMYIMPPACACVTSR